MVTDSPVGRRIGRSKSKAEKSPKPAVLNPAFSDGTIQPLAITDFEPSPRLSRSNSTVAAAAYLTAGANYPRTLPLTPNVHNTLSKVSAPERYLSSTLPRQTFMASPKVSPPQLKRDSDTCPATSISTSLHYFDCSQLNADQLAAVAACAGSSSSTRSDTGSISSVTLTQSTSSEHNRSSSLDGTSLRSTDVHLPLPPPPDAMAELPLPPPPPERPVSVISTGSFAQLNQQQLTTLRRNNFALSAKGQDDGQPMSTLPKSYQRHQPTNSDIGQWISSATANLPTATEYYSTTVFSTSSDSSADNTRNTVINTLAPPPPPIRTSSALSRSNESTHVSVPDTDSHFKRNSSPTYDWVYENPANLQKIDPNNNGHLPPPPTLDFLNKTYIKAPATGDDNGSLGKLINGEDSCRIRAKINCDDQSYFMFSEDSSGNSPKRISNETTTAATDGNSVTKCKQESLCLRCSRLLIYIICGLLLVLILSALAYTIYNHVTRQKIDSGFTIISDVTNYIEKTTTKLLNHPTKQPPLPPPLFIPPLVNISGSEAGNESPNITKPVVKLSQPPAVMSTNQSQPTTITTTPLPITETPHPTTTTQPTPTTATPTTTTNNLPVKVHLSTTTTTTTPSPVMSLSTQALPISITTTTTTPPPVMPLSTQAPPTSITKKTITSLIITTKTTTLTPPIASEEPISKELSSELPIEVSTTPTSIVDLQSNESAINEQRAPLNRSELNSRKLPKMAIDSEESNELVTEEIPIKPRKFDESVESSTEEIPIRLNNNTESSPVTTTRHMTILDNFVINGDEVYFTTEAP